MQLFWQRYRLEELSNAVWIEIKVRVDDSRFAVLEFRPDMAIRWVRSLVFARTLNMSHAQTRPIIVVAPKQVISHAAEV
jgi:hypothetical protein